MASSSAPLRERMTLIWHSHFATGIQKVRNPFYMYDQNLWPTIIEADVKGLTERIIGTWERKDTSPTYMQTLTTGPQTVKA